MKKYKFLRPIGVKNALYAFIENFKKFGSDSGPVIGRPVLSLEQRF